MSAPIGSLVILGLGPGDPDLRTIGAQRALDLADVIILRTRVHPGLDDLATDPRVSDCDDLYQSADQFSELYAAIADRVLERALAGGNVVFAVPGHPRFGEQSVALIESRAQELNITLRVLDAVSFVDTTVQAVHLDPIEKGLQVVDAEQLATTLDAEPYAAGLLGIDPARPLLVAQIYDRKLAAAVKLALSRVYPDEHAVVLVRAFGRNVEFSASPSALRDLDRQTPNHLTSLFVPPVSPLDAYRSPETLARIVARLRAPGGCPWDREQTHASMRSALIEEAYESVDAIDNADDDALAEELGDLLLLVMMHAQMAEESGSFRIEDVYEAINRKLIRRHPHVFADAQAETPDAVIATWEGVKAAERAAKQASAAERSRYDRLPRAMPATRRVVEMLAPRATLAPPDEPHAGDDVLHAMVNLIERGIDPESALEVSLRERTGGEAELVAASVDSARETENGSA
jgi:tetrapyrrole methylase family protein/MazG family protein